MHLAGHEHDTAFGDPDYDTFIYAAGDCVFYQNRFEDTRAGVEQGAHRVAAASTSDGAPAPPSAPYVPYPGDLTEFVLD